MSGVHVNELVVAESGGVWVVRSTSQTVYYIDADSSLLLRQTGPASSRGPGDGRWVPLIQVEAILRGDWGTIRVGDRHKYVFDWDPGGSDFGFWIQRLVTAIDHVEAEELAGLPAISQDEPL